jgi:hypothetical protein
MILKKARKGEIWKEKKSGKERRKREERKKEDTPDEDGPTSLDGQTQQIDCGKYFKRSKNDHQQQDQLEERRTSPHHCLLINAVNHTSPSLISFPSARHHVEVV